MDSTFFRRALARVAIATSICLLPVFSSPVPSAVASPTDDRTALGPLPSQPPPKPPLSEPGGDFSQPPVGAGGAVYESFDPETSRLASQTKSADIFSNNDGSYTAAIHSGVINEFEDGRWSRIDTDLRHDKKAGEARADLGEAEVTFDTAAADVGQLELSSGSSMVTLTPHETTSSPKVETKDNSISYKGVIDEATLSYSTSADRVKEKITLSKAPTSAPTYLFEIATSGLDVDVDADGTIAMSHNGQRVFSIPQGVAIDARDDASAVAVKLVDSNTISVTPDWNWLKDSSRKYPVVVDPDIVIEIGRQTHNIDAFVSSVAPDTNFNGNNQIEINAYVDKVGYQSFRSSEFYSYLQFDVTPIMGKQIRNARLETRIYTKAHDDDFIAVHPVAQPWDENAITWNSRPNHYGQTKFMEDLVVNDWSRLDVTDWVQNWSHARWPNHGLSFDTVGEDSFVRFGATEMSWKNEDPVIFVTYNTVSPGVELVSPVDGANVPTTTPELVGNPVSDADGDIPRYWFRVSNTDNPEVGGITNSGWLDSPRWTIPPGSLIDGVTYSWYVGTGDFDPTINQIKSIGWSAIRKLKVNLRLGDQVASPDDTIGPVSVNLTNGNVSTATSSPTVRTVGGGMGLEYTYNSQAQSTTGLVGRYYPGCNGQSSGPLNAYNPYLVRTDPTIDFNWGTGTPTTSIGTDDFCVQWDGFLSVPRGNTYCFDAGSDDGIRVWVNGQKLIDRWFDQATPPGANPPGCVGIFSDKTVPIHVEYYERGGGAAVQLLIDGPNLPSSSVIPPSWLSTTPSVLPKGWQLNATTSQDTYVRAIITDRSVVLEDGTGDRDEFTRTSGNQNAGYTPPSGEQSTLSLTQENGSPVYVVQSPDGITSTFNDRGALVRVVSASDDRKPAATEYMYDPGVDTARLVALRDPVSKQEIKLRYSTGPTDPGPCPPSPAGFDTRGPSGTLCDATYPDGSTTLFFYKDGQLARIVDPGNEVTDFGYENGLLTAVADPLQMDRRAIAPNTSGGYTRINYQDGKAVSIVLASPDGSDPKDTPPTTNRPWHSYTYVAPMNFDTGGETRVHFGGVNPSQGFARRVVFNNLAQTLTDTDISGSTAETEWSPKDRLLRSKDLSTGSQTTYFYDDRDRTTDVFGPAPASCFGGDRRPTGTCKNPLVAHTSTRYDEGIKSLAAAYYPNTALAGAPVLHSTGVGNPSGEIDVDWGTGAPVGLAQSDNWSLRLTGSVKLEETGGFRMRMWADDGVRVWIDDKLMVDAWTVSPFRVIDSPELFQNSVAGSWHRVRIDYFEATIDARLVFALVNPHGVQGNFPGVNLRPDYGLVTSEQTDDSNPAVGNRVKTTSYSGPGIDPAYGLATSDSEGGLTTTTTYETPGNGFLRPIGRTLPGGATSTSTYYGNSETINDPCGSGASLAQKGMLRSKADPRAADGSMRTETFAYDSWGRIRASKIGNDTWSCVTYDSRGRAVSKSLPSYGGAPARTITSDHALGGDPRVNRVTDSSGSITTVVDMLGRTTVYTDASGLATSTTYDLAGRITQTSNGAQGTSALTYDPLGRPISQRLNGVVVATSGYDPQGRLTKVTYPTPGGNGTKTSMSYDQSERLKSLIHTRLSPATDIATDSVIFGQSGVVVDQSIDGVDSRSGGANFVYDSAGRLIESWSRNSHQRYSFADSPGCASRGGATTAGRNTNRTSLLEDGKAARSYCYDQADRLIWSDDPRYNTVAYDSHGNTTRLGDTTMTYDIVDRHLTTTSPSAKVAYKRDANDRIIERSTASINAPEMRSLSNAQNGTGSTSLTIAKPADTQPGDVLLAHVVVSAGSSVTITPPAGWTQVTNRNNANLLRSVVWTHVVQPSEPSSFAFTFSKAVKASGGIAAYSGVDATNPVSGSSTNSSATSQTSHISGSVTTAATNGRLVNFVATRQTAAVTQGTGFTERWEATNANAVAAKSEMSDKVLQASGSTGSVTTTTSMASDSVTQMLVLAPAPTLVTRYAYTGPGDGPSVTRDAGNSIVDVAVGVLGGATRTEHRSGATSSITWQYPNVHGDVIAQADNTGNKVGATFTYDPFGQGATPDDMRGDFDHGWLGNKLRSTEHEGSLGTIEMGARQYVPGLGRFLEVDPIEGGSANDYDYAEGDPVNGYDIEGTRCLTGKNKNGSCRSIARGTKRVVSSGTKAVKNEAKKLTSNVRVLRDHGWEYYGPGIRNEFNCLVGGPGVDCKHTSTLRRGVESAGGWILRKTGTIGHQMSTWIIKKRIECAINTLYATGPALDGKQPTGGTPACPKA